MENDCWKQSLWRNFHKIASSQKNTHNAILSPHFSNVVMYCAALLLLLMKCNTNEKKARKNHLHRLIIISGMEQTGGEKNATRWGNEASEAVNSNIQMVCVRTLFFRWLFRSFWIPHLECAVAYKESTCEYTTVLRLSSIYSIFDL